MKRNTIINLTFHAMQIENWNKTKAYLNRAIAQKHDHRFVRLKPSDQMWKAISIVWCDHIEISIFIHTLLKLLESLNVIHQFHIWSTGFNTLQSSNWIQNPIPKSKFGEFAIDFNFPSLSKWIILKNDWIKITGHQWNKSFALLLNTKSK